MIRNKAMRNLGTLKSTLGKLLEKRLIPVADDTIVRNVMDFAEWVAWVAQTAYDTLIFVFGFVSQVHDGCDVRVPFLLNDALCS